MKIARFFHNCQRVLHRSPLAWPQQRALASLAVVSKGGEM